MLLARRPSNLLRCVATLFLALNLCLLAEPLEAAAPPPSAERPIETVRLQLKWPHQFQFAGYYAAQIRGYYAEEGLRVDIRELDPAKNVVDQVASGEADYGIGDSGIISAYASGQPIVALAAIFQHDPLVFISKRSSGIISPYEVAGKRIMTNEAGNDDSPLRAILFDAGLKRGDYVSVPHTFTNQDLIEGRVDVMSAYLTNELYYFRQQGVPLNIINPQSYGVDFYGDLLFTSHRELSEHPGRAERFRRASLKGWQYALAHPEELILIIRDRYHGRHSVEHLRFEAAESRKLILPDVIPLGQIEIGRLRRVSEIYARLTISAPLTDRQLENFIYGISDKLNLTARERAWLVRHPVIRLGIDRDFAPYEWIDENGDYVGLVADFMKLLEQRLGVRFEVVEGKTAAETLAMVKNGQLDMIGAVTKTPDRQSYLAFSSPYVSSPAVIVNDDRFGFIGSPDHLAGKRVVIERRHLDDEPIARDHPEIRLVAVDDIRTALSLVAQDKADAYIGDAISTSYAIRQTGLLDLRFSGQTRYPSERRVAVSKRHPELFTIIEKTLAAIPQAERNAIIDRWTGIRIEPGISSETLVRYGAVLFGLFLLFAYWLVRLLREVRARKQSEARLMSLYTSMTIGFALYEVVRDAEGNLIDFRCLEVNPAFESLTGISRERWIGHTVKNLLPDAENRWIEHFGKVATTGESSTFEYCSETTGRWFFTYSYRPESEQFALLLRDITDQKHAERRDQARNKVLDQLSHGAALSVILESIVRSVEQELPGTRSSILLQDVDARHFRFGAAPNLPDFYRSAVLNLEIDADPCSCVLSARKNERVIIRDIRQESLCPHHREIALKADLMSCWSEPIRVGSGNVMGIFTIYHRTASAPDDEEIALVEHAANLAAVAIDRSRSNEALQLAHMVYQNSTEAMMVTDMENRIIAINPAFARMTGYSSQELLGRKPKLLNSGRNDRKFYREIAKALKTTGNWQGEVWNRRKNGQEFAGWLTINTIYSEDRVPQRRVSLCSDITEKKRADTLIWTQANYDALTQLPNRRLFRDRLDQEIRKAHRDQQIFALLFLDLDSFKEVNDTHGHHMGDELLVEASKRIRRCVRESDTVARLGGDEFTIILSELGNVSDIERIAENVIAVLNEPFHLGEDRAYVSASVGITVYPYDGTTVEGLLQNADQAMYAAKSEGRGRLSYFTPSMQQAAQKRVRLARDLRLALAEDQFQIYYQPIVELSTGTISKAEALLRWRHPEKGYISPADFIPIAEDSGAIHDIGDWVFRTAARQTQLWRARYGADFQVSINKSPVQFHSDNRIQDRWIDYLHELGLDGGSIVIEITEGLLLNAERGVIDKLLNFRDNRVQVAIDDFGTGYSSLAYLKKFSIDYLKIDQSFTRNLALDTEDVALCEAVVIMAHKLGLKVIAEGVENQLQHDLLSKIGCDYGQGFLFAEPMEPGEFEQLLQSPGRKFARSFRPDEDSMHAFRGEPGRLPRDRS